MTQSAADARPLAGIRVIDFTSLVAGPWCTRLLADCGAEVIKIEAVGDGDILRHSPPVHDGMSRVFAHFNCGKKSIALNLKSPAGLALARQLIAEADIVVENYRPGVMARLGLDYRSLSASHEKLIYCSVSGFGQSGPRATQGAYAPVVHALSGFDHVFMQAQGAATPPVSGIMVADVVAAAYAFGAIQTALVHRERHGRGSSIDATLIESMMSLVAIQYQESQSDAPITSVRFPPVAAKDGHLIVPMVSVRNYQALFSVIGRDDWRSSITTLGDISRNRQTILDAVAAWAREQTVAEIESLMIEAGIPASRYATPAEMLEDAHLRGRGSFSLLSDAAGEFVVLNAPFRMEGVRCAANPRVARCGEDTDDVLNSILGLDASARSEQAAQGAFG